MKKALILGINGQDGSYLAEILLEKNYEVHGLVRRSSTGNTRNIKHIISDLNLHYGDLSDAVSIYDVINSVRPNEIYNEADQDHAGVSFEIPAYNFDVTGSAVGRILEIIRKIDKKIRYFQPLTSNMFGKAKESPQNENTPFNPQNPYACAKTFAYHLCKMYREVYNMYVSVGIFYNHESPRRIDEYVTRKITKAAVKIKLGKQKTLVLGDIESKIDWGFSKDYMYAAHQIMQLDKSDVFIIGTGLVHSVRNFIELAFREVDLDPAKYLKTSSKFIRPSSNSILVADITKAKQTFNFNPQTTLEELVKMMIKNDMENELL
tara:strand:+ start:925 stop:1884 length:960 start_codon:yes stop_codon:yes gene_type:complete